MDNFKNVPQYLYSLSPTQMDMFMTEHNPVRLQSETVTEGSISSARDCLDNGGMWSMSGINDRGPSKHNMSVSMYHGGARGYGRPRTAPPDLPSLLLDARICHLGMPAEELVANIESCTELLAKGTGKTKEEITKDVPQPKYFQAQEAIDYGLADKIIDSRNVAFEKQNYDEMLAQSNAMRSGAGAGAGACPQVAPSGFR